MTRALVAIAALLALFACGADGAPEPRDTGIGISGEAKIGVVGDL